MNGVELSFSSTTLEAQLLGECLVGLFLRPFFGGDVVGLPLLWGILGVNYTFEPLSYVLISARRRFGSRVHGRI